ncbi:MAG TPA: YihY/virulence factor BrkB family protein [Sphingomicrobium sp.]|nr:YihY/virulence factor BrkB family protein [Sphingomicrobium sp.]
MSASTSDDNGQFATAPWRMPLSAWKRIGLRAWNQSWIDNAGLVAAGVAFYGFLAIVPLLGIIVLVYGLVAEPETVVRNMQAMMAVLPTDVAVLIGQQLMTAVQASQGAKGLAILAALGVGLYGGTNAASAIILALNIAYQEKEKRSLLQFYKLALAMTIGALLLMLFGLAATTAVASLDRILPSSSPVLVTIGRIASYVVLVLGAAAVAATLYRFGPSREDARWTWITAGSLFTAVGWILLTFAFGFYITRVTDYGRTYGSLGAMVALLTWLYLSAYVFVFGAELNSEVEHQTAIDSTTGPPEPIGRRGAWAADHVADAEDDGASRKDAEAGPTLAEASPPSPTAEHPERD